MRQFLVQAQNIYFLAPAVTFGINENIFQKSTFSMMKTRGKKSIVYSSSWKRQVKSMEAPTFKL